MDDESNWRTAMHEQLADAAATAWEADQRALALQVVLGNLLLVLHASGAIDARAFIGNLQSRLPGQLPQDQMETVARLLADLEGAALMSDLRQGPPPG